MCVCVCVWWTGWGCVYGVSRKDICGIGMFHVNSRFCSVAKCKENTTPIHGGACTGNMILRKNMFCLSVGWTNMHSPQYSWCWVVTWIMFFRVDRDRSGQITAVELGSALSNGKYMYPVNCLFGCQELGFPMLIPNSTVLMYCKSYIYQKDSLQCGVLKWEYHILFKQ